MGQHSVCKHGVSVEAIRVGGRGQLHALAELSHRQLSGRPFLIPAEQHHSRLVQQQLLALPAQPALLRQQQQLVPPGAGGPPLPAGEQRPIRPAAAPQVVAPAISAPAPNIVGQVLFACKVRRQGGRQRRALKAARSCHIAFALCVAWQPAGASAIPRYQPALHPAVHSTAMVMD